MSGIYISYRREDAQAYAGLLTDALRAQFGHDAVLRDLLFGPGQAAAEMLEQAVAGSEAMIVVIGPKWLTAGRDGERRLDDPRDLVRWEITTALDLGIYVIPVLIEETEMPAAHDVPEPLRRLTMRHPARLSDAHWDHDLSVLVETLKKFVRVPESSALKGSATTTRSEPSSTKNPTPPSEPAAPVEGPPYLGATFTSAAVDCLMRAMLVARGYGAGRRLLAGVLLHESSPRSRGQPHLGPVLAQHLLGPLAVPPDALDELITARLGVVMEPGWRSDNLEVTSSKWGDLTDLVGLATELSTRGGRGGEVDVHHLVGALFVREPTVLEGAGADIPTLGAILYGILRSVAPEDFAGWGDLLQPPEVARRSWLAGYAADVVGGEDRLGVQDDVDMLCSVLAAGPPVRPPLSVGLFGDWGSGKSFFMDLMRKRVTLLAEASARAKAAGLPSSYCSRVCQITFNAWHYADANLWASLVAEIFRELADQTDADATGLVGKLEMASEQVRQAEARQKRAEDAVESLANGIEDLEREREASQTRLTGFVADVADGIQSDARLRKELDALGQRLGVTSDNVGDARQLPWQARATLVTARRLWSLLSTEQRRRSMRKGAAVAIAAVVATVLAFLVARSAESDLVRVVTPMVPFVVAGVGFVGRTLARTRKALAHALIEQQLGAARREKSLADEEVAAAQVELSDVQAGRRLPQFIQDRSRSVDYQQHLGLIALVRRDFELLSSLLLPAAADDGSGRQGREQGVPEIDRIILYIDDLDRCPADRVVEVLQAVHLLLALPLFVVVVGVDSRWLLRSLQRHYAVQLTSGAGDDISGADGAKWASTPQNYLEKIFQIPFALRPMGAESYRSLARSLLPAYEDPEPVELVLAPGGDGRQADGAVAAGEPRSVAAADAEAPEDSDTDPVPVDRQPSERKEGPPGPESPARSSGGATGPPPLDVAPESLRITPSELAFLEELYSFVPSPRSAKRLVNTYRLLRVSVPRDELPAFLGEEGHEPQFPAVFLLLAVLVGFPDEAPEFFARILGQPSGTTWPGHVRSLASRASPAGSDPRAWGLLLDRLADVQTRAAVPQDLEVFRFWAPRAARFSFGTGRAVFPAASPPTRPI